MNKKQRRSKRKRKREQKDVCINQQIPAHLKPLYQTVSEIHINQRIPLWTKTGELFQPVRLYYAIRKPQKIQKHLHALQCMRPESGSNQWTWLHTAEASTVTFEKKTAHLKKPVELGTLVFFGESSLFLDVYSIERALAAMMFFDRRLPRRLARMTHLSIVNSLFDSHSAHTFQFPACTASDAQANDPILTIFQQLDTLNKRGRTPQEKRDTVASYLQTTVTQAFPRIEHLALRFSRKAYRQIRFLLESRQYVAIQRWKGDDQITLSDYVHALIQAESPSAPKT
jgi:hypothetical protein